MRILIVEDNPDIAGNIGDYLEARGHVVDFASDGMMGLHLAVESKFELIVLDINLPKMDGLTLCRTLREDKSIDTPVLMLTARGAIADKIAGFEVGAWDYLVKPFELRELELRIQALRLRSTPKQGRALEVGDLRLDLDGWNASREGKTLNLRRANVQILEQLMRAWPNVVTRQDLEFYLWEDNPPSSDSLRTHIYELRCVLDKPFGFNMLRTLRGIGYVLKIESGEGND